MGETAQALFKEIAPALELPYAKVTVVGVGQVGMACAFTILQQVIITRCNFRSFEITFANQ